MITLVVDNSTCQLLDLPFEVWKDLRELLSYQMDARAAYFSSARSNTRYLMDKRGNFPTGLLYLVEDYLATKGVSHRKEDRRKRPAPRPGLFKLKLEGQ